MRFLSGFWAYSCFEWREEAALRMKLIEVTAEAFLGLLTLALNETACGRTVLQPGPSPPDRPGSPELAERALPLPSCAGAERSPPASRPPIRRQEGRPVR